MRDEIVRCGFTPEIIDALGSLETWCGSGYREAREAARRSLREVAPVSPSIRWFDFRAASAPAR